MRFVPTFPAVSFGLSRRVIAPLLCVLMLFYLGFHAVSGERGVFALFKETRKLEQLTAELDNVKQRRQLLEGKVKRMSSHALDLDMLDEQAKNVIGFAAKDEVVIFQK